MDIAKHPDRAHKLEVQIVICLIKDLQIRNSDNYLGKVYKMCAIDC